MPKPGMIFEGGVLTMDENGEIRGTQYYDSKIIARLFKISVRRVQQLTQEGVLSTVAVIEGGRTLRRYDLVPTIQAYVAYLSDKAYGRSSATAKEKELKEKKMEAEAELKASQAELHKLRTKIASGDYISREEVKIDYSRFFVVFKKFVSSIPAMVSGMIAPYADPTEVRKLEKDLTGEFNKVLQSFVVAGVGPDQVKERRSGSKKAKDPKV